MGRWLYNLTIDGIVQKRYLLFFPFCVWLKSNGDNWEFVSIYKCLRPLTVLSRKQQLVFCQNLCHNYFFHISFQYFKIVWDRPCQASTMLESPLSRCAGHMMSPRLYFEEDHSLVNNFAYEKQLTFNFRGKIGTIF